ncbi:MAG: ATPase, T2SS/T4P/T4SS family [Thermodesulfobacteriota bacterium]|nr:ATPase, T2SS/T4P/T4SS family [Thermodesulfobacteriota bacterium]
MEKSLKEKGTSKRRKKLGEYLIESGLIDEKTLMNALEIQKVQKKRLGQILIDIGAATDEQISQALSSQLKIPHVHLDKIDVPDKIISLIPSELAENYLLIPVKETDNELVVAMANPLDLYAIDDVRFVTQMSIKIAVAPQNDVLDAIEKYYPKQYLQDDLKSGMGTDESVEIIHEAKTEEKDTQDLENLSELPPIVRLINAIISDAIKHKASDIHIEPQDKAVVVRFRVDGIMREIMKTDKHVHASMVSRIKIISNMDISIRRTPQDGRSQVRYKKKMYDLRVSTIPASYGETVTIRILDKEAVGRKLEDLGLSEKAFKDLTGAISKPQGIILVTGPTGSGKSSTLYTCLTRLNSPTVNIITVEDPIEYEVSGINQVQVNPKAGITFAAGLRSILRQDPDIVMVGEIRDSETASIAFQAAQTGHLVLSTLHTNDTTSAVTRLLDLHVEPFLISDSLLAVIGQRLVRKICPKCKKSDPMSNKIAGRVASYIGKDKKAKFYKGTGCESCQYTGYSGRLAIFEVLRITPSLREAIEPKVSSLNLRKIAERSGLQSIFLDGIEKAIKGLTTIEEVYRVASPEESEQSHTMEDSVLRETKPEKYSPGEYSSPISSVKPKKILVADDNEVTLRLFRNFLESENYNIITAKNGLEALKLSLQEVPDLIITDFLMPKLDGINLTKKLKSNLTTRYIPVIIITAKDDVDFEVKGIDAGADDYLTKPVNSKKLLARVNRLLKKPTMGKV